MLEILGVHVRVGKDRPEGGKFCIAPHAATTAGLGCRDLSDLARTPMDRTHQQKDNNQHPRHIRACATRMGIRGAAERSAWVMVPSFYTI